MSTEDNFNKAEQCEKKVDEVTMVQYFDMDEFYKSDGTKEVTAKEYKAPFHCIEGAKTLGAALVSVLAVAIYQ